MNKFNGIEIVIDSIEKNLDCPECGKDITVEEDGQGAYYYRKNKKNNHSPYCLYICSECGYKFLTEIEKCEINGIKF